MFSNGPKATYPWVLKGGYAMELRMHSARTTKDFDLTLLDGSRLSRDPKERGEQARAMLQEAAATPLTTIANSSSEKHERIWTARRKAAAGIPSKTRMDGRDFSRFHVHVGVRDEVLEPLEVVTGEDWLGFGGIAPPSFPVISAEQQFAEKLHAYTQPLGACKHPNQGPYRHGAFDQRRNDRQK
jgi:Nucleotidyl transferase AbiEii toxin, Type IV TA system